MTGTLAGATAALNDDLPFIGEGNFRRVYRDGDTVYKVENVEGSDLESNTVEYRNVYNIASYSLPANVAVPNVTLYHVNGSPVIAMDYIDGLTMGDCYCTPNEKCGPDCLPRGLVADLLSVGIDTAYGNVIMRDGTYFLIDLDADLV